MFLAYPNIVTSLPGPKAKHIIEKDNRFTSPSYTRDYPLVVAKAQGCQITDVDGNKFLDFTAGIAVTNTGHCHPDVVNAITQQAQQLIHMCGADFYYESQAKLAKQLCKLMPNHDKNRICFCNSGTEAIEGAIKLARYATGRKQIIAFFGAFHGRTAGSLSLTASKTIQKENYFPLLPGIHHAPYPNPVECPDNMTEEDYASWCVNWIQEKLFKTILPPNEVAAIIVEPIQGEGGYIVPPKNFHQELQALCQKHGILYIVDEIQAGMGRTGKFFACEHFNVQPDIVTVAKGLASGLPLGAFISRASIMNWQPGSHASTFGGNPIACAAALVTIDLVETELMSNAKKMGNYLKQELQNLQQQFSFITDVRGIGLMLAIEIGNAKEIKTVKSDIELRHEILQQAFQKGLILLGCGTKAIRFCPALMVSKLEIDIAIDILKSVFTKL